MSTESSRSPDRGRESRLLPWLLALVAAYVVFSGAPWGPGLTPDSVWYMHSARSLANGWHATQLPSQWPPGFPIVLALAEIATKDFFTGARLLQAVVGAANVLLFCRLLERGGVSRTGACVVALLLMVQPAFLDVHLMLWSEPTFLSLVLLDLLLLQSMLDGSAKSSRACWLGLACGAAIIVRYAGLFLIPVNVLAILLLSGRALGPWQRIRSASATAVLSLLPLCGWMLFNRARGVSATNRNLEWHPAGAEHLAQLLRTVASWARVPGYLGALVFLVVMVAVAVGLWAARRSRSKSSIAGASLALCVLVYGLFLWLTISLADYSTPLDERILSPIFPVCMALLAILANAASERIRVLAFSLSIAALFWLLAFGGAVAWRNWHLSRAEGVSLSSRYYREMPVLAWLGKSPMQARVFSNGPELLDIYLQRDARMLPPKIPAGSKIPASDYPKVLAEALAQADSIVYFYPMAERAYLASPPEIDLASGFPRAYDGPDAVVWINPLAAAAPQDRHP